MIERIDAISRVIYDPTGRQTGAFYPANATHWRGKLIRKSARSRRADSAPVSPFVCNTAKTTNLAVATNDTGDAPEVTRC